MLFSGRFLKEAYLIVFFLVTCCALLTGYILVQEDLKRVHWEQNKAGEQFAVAIKGALNTYLIEVNSLAAFFEASPNSQVSATSFDAFSRPLIQQQSNPILNSFYARYVTSEDKAQFVQSQRALTGLSRMDISPGGARGEYLPLTYGYPDVILHGLDLIAPDSPYRASALAARDSGKPVMTPPTILGADRARGQTRLDAFVLRQPIYLSNHSRLTEERRRELFSGLVGVAFKVEGLLSQIDYLVYRGLAFRIADVTDANNDTAWFYDTHSATPDFWSEMDLNQTEFDFSGRRWRIESRNEIQPWQAVNWGLLAIPSVCFMVLGVLLSWYVRGLSAAHASIQEAANEQLEVDELTGLSSRYQINRLLEFKINKCRHQGHKLAVMYMDLDHFKTINDAFGHETGDKLLFKVAQRLSSVLPNGSSVGRLGGDEFLALIEQGQQVDRDNLIYLAKEIISQVSRSYFIDGRLLTVGCSIGVATFPEYGMDTSTLVKNADMAMYEAKSMGRATYHFYDGDMGRRLARNVRIETRLRQSMQDGALELYFQPKVDLNSLKCIGLEALLRWEDKELGRVSPAEFIPIAEQSGLILPLGEWVLQRACEQIKQWQGQGISVPPIAINCSAAQLKRDDFLHRLLETLDKYEVDPEHIELEVTESILIEDAESCAELLRQVARLGIKLAIDDFGTGYSSLSYLKDLPFHCVKIDQVFIRDMLEDANHGALTTAIIKMSHSLNLQVVAEGITSEEQRAFLLEQGCDIGQGFLFGEAFHADQLQNGLSGPGWEE